VWCKLKWRKMNTAKIQSTFLSLKKQSLFKLISNLGCNWNRLHASGLRCVLLALFLVNSCLQWMVHVSVPWFLVLVFVLIKKHCNYIHISACHLFRSCSSFSFFSPPSIPFSVQYEEYGAGIAVSCVQGHC